MMGFETKTILTCDTGCGNTVEYKPAEVDFKNLAAAPLPKGWARDYDNGDTVFGYVCGECIEEFGEDK